MKKFLVEKTDLPLSTCKKDLKCALTNVLVALFENV